jgi:hypothetical protein
VVFVLSAEPPHHLLSFGGHPHALCLNSVEERTQIMAIVELPQVTIAEAAFQKRCL